MLLLGERLLGTPVMSLQVGVKVAETVEPVIDPRNLVVVAYEVDGPLLESHPKFIRIADIRELSDIGMIIDSSDELVDLEDVIKIKEIRGLNFKLVGMKVIDERGRRLGKVEDYTIDTDSFVVQQLSVRGGLLNNLSSTGHMIHRSQITEISDTVITVKSTDKKLTSLETQGNIHRTYTNPFRKPAEPQPETVTTD
ncbi:hypothetical protein B7Y92_03665 [Candidatus Saccharibacteria bacterium 32-50-13]|nr:MAG: hypothetical protein B7Y92_03665 [Candidatus Saccharibacteria bacterium 32-50-13]